MLIRFPLVLLLLLTPLSQNIIDHSTYVSISSLSFDFDSLMVVSAAPARRSGNKRKPKRPNVEVLHNKAGIGKFFNMVLCRKEWEDIHDRWVGDIDDITCKYRSHTSA